DGAAARRGGRRGGGPSARSRVDRHHQRCLRAPEDRRRAPRLGGRGLADRPGRTAVSVEALARPLNPTLAERLDAVVRPEFRLDVLVPAVGDPIPGTPPGAGPGGGNA